MSNRERRRKLKKFEKQSNGENDEIIRMIKVFAIVVLALVSFYFIFAIYNGEISFGSKEEEKSEVEIQNVKILAGSTFNRIDSEYYVLFYDFEGDYAANCLAIYNLYNQKENNLKMYIVDLNDSFNKKYVVDSNSLVNVNNIDELKVIDASLIKVKNGKAEFVISGNEEISNYLETLLK